MLGAGPSYGAVVQQLRVGIVGCGAIARWHAEAMHTATRTVVTACVDPVAENAAALAELTGGQACASIDEALAIGVDALSIMVPHHLHEVLAIEALEAGVHVMIEKPMAPTVTACERILAVAAERPAQVFMVAENSQYWPEIAVVAEQIAAGAIGEVVTARSWHNSGPPPEFYPGDKPWRFSAEVMCGGVAMDTGSHWLRPLRVVLGEVDEVVAVTGRIWPEMDGESMVRALIRHRSGITSSLDVMLARGAVSYQPHFQFIGTKGELLVTVAGEVLLFDGRDRDGTVVGRGNYMHSYRGVWVDFEAAVLDGRALAADAAFSLGELRTALAIEASAASRTWEPVW